MPMKRAIKAHYFEDNMDDFNFMVSFPNAWRLHSFEDQPEISDYINVIDSKIRKKRSTVNVNFYCNCCSKQLIFNLNIRQISFDFNTLSMKFRLRNAIPKFIAITKSIYQF